MSTERIYYKDSYVKEFKANVLSVKEYNGKYAVILDKTAFYPEGGGQPSDKGFINNIPVLGVIEEENEILHIVPAPINSNEADCIIDWVRRFDHMQQHSGQHILSACFFKHLGGRTNSFHLGKDFVSIEIDIKEFNEALAAEIEDMANRIIYNNLPVIAKFVEPYELAKLPLRKQPIVEDNIRIVEVERFDYSPCGGTHVSKTGEIGIIKIRRFERSKGGYRIEFVCGFRALKDYRLKNAAVYYIGAKLSANETDVVEAFDKTLEDLKNANKKIGALKAELLSYISEELIKKAIDSNGIKIVSVIFTDRDINEAKVIAQNIIHNTGHIALLICKGNDLKVILSRSADINIDMGSLLKSTLPIINGKGGGNCQAAQGGGSEIEKAEEFARAILEKLKQHII